MVFVVRVLTQQTQDSSTLRLPVFEYKKYFRHTSLNKGSRNEKQNKSLHIR